MDELYVVEVVATELVVGDLVKYRPVRASGYSRPVECAIAEIEVSDDEVFVITAQGDYLGSAPDAIWAVSRRD